MGNQRGAITSDLDPVVASLRRGPVGGPIPLKDLPFYATMIDALIERGQELLVAAYDGSMTDEKIDGITDITNRIVTVSRWLFAAQSVAEEAASGGD